MRNFNFYPDLIQHVMEVHRKEAKAAGGPDKDVEFGRSKQGKKVTQQVFKIKGDANLVKLNMFPNKKGGKPMVLDLSKLKGLIKSEEPGKRNVVTMPASALAGSEEEADEESPGTSKAIVIEPAKKKQKVADVDAGEDEEAPALSEEDQSENAGIRMMTAALNLQPKVAEIKSDNVPKTPATRTRSKTGPSPPLPQKLPVAKVEPSPQPQRAATSRAKSSGTSKPPVVMYPSVPKPQSIEPQPSTSTQGSSSASKPETSTSPTEASPQAQRKKHQPAILKRGSSSGASSDAAPQMLQAVGKDQVKCNQCGEVLATMKAVASHKCLTGAGDKEWNLQRIDAQGGDSDVEWYVAS